MRFMNKKGASFMGWTDVILMSLLFVIVLGFVIAGFNDKYDKNYDTTMGLSTNSTPTAFSNLQNSYSSATSEGEASTDAQTGLTLSSTWLLIRSTGTIIWNFLTGSWIEKTCAMMQLPAIVGAILRILYFLSIGLSILRLLL